MEHEVTVAAEQVAIPQGLWARLPRVGLILAIVGLGSAFATSGGHHDRLLFSYLVAFMFWLSFALGGMFFTLVQYITRAGWSVVVRRLGEHVMGTLPVFALLFIPIALGVHDLFHWSHAEAVAHDELLQHKAAFLNPGAFYVRAAIYFAVWTFCGTWLWRLATSQDDGDGAKILRKLQTLSPVGLILFGLTMSFAAIDWMMSLDPHWYSTIFGVYYFAGCVIAICALLILMALLLQRSGRLQGVVTAEHYHDLGKLLFAFMVFWAYIAFSQFMLIWYANIPEETAFFAHRWEHGWKNVSLFLVIGHFAIPFLFLLMRDVKRHAAGLITATVWLCAMHYLDMYWLIMPAFGDGHFDFKPVDIMTLIGVGGVFVATLAWRVSRTRLVPVNDPRLQESLAFENY